MLTPHLGSSYQIQTYPQAPVQIPAVPPALASPSFEPIPFSAPPPMYPMVDQSSLLRNGISSYTPFSLAPVSDQFGIPALSPSTPPLSHIPPWASHNPYAGPMSPITPVTPALPFLPEVDEPHIRRGSVISSSSSPFNSMGKKVGANVKCRSSLSNLHGAMSSTSTASSMHSRQRTWSVTVGNTPDGDLVPIGLVADDGTVIQHGACTHCRSWYERILVDVSGPGQHIRPAPLHGPGSLSASGLVDYSNVFIKNLDPDINSYFLEETFGNVSLSSSLRVYAADV